MLFAIILGALLAGTAAAASAPSQLKQGQQPWNLKGKLLIFDVSSLSFQGNHPVFPPLSEPSSCRDVCLQTLGCTGWTFCNSSGGCGSGCAAYTKQNPQLKTAPNGNPTLPNPEWAKQPALTGFGPWGLTGGCAPQGDRFPRGMCSLKALAKPAEPEFWSKDAGEGWVSGWVAPPPECAGLSARACSRCLSSPAPAACLTCAKDAARAGNATTLSSAVAPTSALTPPDGCANCYASKAPDACVACLLGRQPCGQCALQLPAPGASLDIAACINCTRSYGGRYLAACTSCAAQSASAPAGAVGRCMACLARASKVACNATDWPPGCWNPEQGGSSSCAACAAAPASAYEPCVACVERKPFSDSCGGCAVLGDAAKAARCYACARAASTPYGVCSDCLAYSADGAAAEACLACAVDPKTSVEGKQFCSGCRNWCSSSPAKVAQCVACLRTQQSDYVSACACRD